MVDYLWLPTTFAFISCSPFWLGVLQGVLKVNQMIEVRPGIVVKDENGYIKCTPIYSRIVSLYAEQNELQFAVPGGLIGVGTTMDPTLTRGDRLVGQVLGEIGSLPEIFVELEVRVGKIDENLVGKAKLALKWCIF